MRKRYERFEAWLEQKVEDHPSILIGAAIAIILSGLILSPVAAVDPISNLTPGGNLTNYTAVGFQWSPETGYYTRWWFNTSVDFFDVYGLFYSMWLPVATQISWGWLFFLIWGTMTTGFYLWAQESTLPFVIAVLGGSALSYAMGADQIFLMVLVVVFLGAGILTKAVLGRR
jgi:hypothetical protein